MSSIFSAQVGDKLVYRTMSGDRVVVISRVTATQAIIDNSLRFARKDGKRVGTNGYYSIWARMPSKDDLAELEFKQRAAALERWLAKFQVTKENSMHVEQFYAAIKAAEKAPA